MTPRDHQVLEVGSGQKSEASNRLQNKDRQRGDEKEDKGPRFSLFRLPHPPPPHLAFFQCCLMSNRVSNRVHTCDVVCCRDGETGLSSISSCYPQAQVGAAGPRCTRCQGRPSHDAGQLQRGGYAGDVVGGGAIVPSGIFEPENLPFHLADKDTGGKVYVYFLL